MPSGQVSPRQPSPRKTSQHIPSPDRTDPIGAMLSWVSSKVPGVTDLTRDFVDGCNIVRLYEACTKKEIPIQWIPSPSNLHANRQNIGRIVAFLENTRCIKKGSIPKEDLLWGDIRSTYAILRAMNIVLDHGNLPPLGMTFNHRRPPTKSPSCCDQPEPPDAAKSIVLGEDEYRSTAVLDAFAARARADGAVAACECEEEWTEEEQWVEEEERFEVATAFGAPASRRSASQGFAFREPPLPPDERFRSASEVLPRPRVPRDGDRAQAAAPHDAGLTALTAAIGDAVAAIPARPDSAGSREGDAPFSGSSAAPISLIGPFATPKAKAATWSPPERPVGEFRIAGYRMGVRPVWVRVPRPPRSQHVVGIDIGTQFVRYGVFRDGGLAFGSVLQSVVAFSGEQTAVGGVPDELAAREDTVVVSDLKRVIARDPADAAFAGRLPFALAEDPRTRRAVVRVGARAFAPEELLGMLLASVRASVSAQAGENVVDAVICVPAFFTAAQRQAARGAAASAGLNVLEAMRETAAAALAFNAKNRSDEPRFVVVFDMGAGKLDVLLAKLEGAVCTVVKTAGNARLGGADVDEILLDRLSLEGFESVAARELRSECERAKIELSSADETEISVPESGESRAFTRAELEEVCEEFFQACLDSVRELFVECQIDKMEVSKVLLVGGSTKIPKLRQILAEFFGDEVELFDADLNDVTVVEGAAMRGALIKGGASGVLEGLVIRDATPLSLGVSLANGVSFTLLPRGTVSPAKCSTTATTFRDGQSNIGFDIVQGERQLAQDNIKLGHITVDGIEKAKRGVPKILVEMELNEDGILIVTAQDPRTEVPVLVRIENRGDLSREAVESLLEEAETERNTFPDLRERAEAKSELSFFLDRAKTAFDAEMHRRRLKFAVQEKCRLAIVTCRDWIETHPNETIGAYNDQYAYVSRIVNEVVAVQ